MEMNDINVLNNIDLQKYDPRSREEIKTVIAMLLQGEEGHKHVQAHVEKDFQKAKVHVLNVSEKQRNKAMADRTTDK